MAFLQYVKQGALATEGLSSCKRATMDLYSFAVGTGLRNSNVAQRAARSLALISSDYAVL